MLHNGVCQCRCRGNSRNHVFHCWKASQVRFRSRHWALPQGFLAKDKVTKVDFSGNTIGIEASEALSKALAKHKDTIVEVDFSDLYTGRLNTEIPSPCCICCLLCCNVPTWRLSTWATTPLACRQLIRSKITFAKAVSVEHLILSNKRHGSFCWCSIGKCLAKLAQAKLSKESHRWKRSSVAETDWRMDLSTTWRSVWETTPICRPSDCTQNGIRPAGIAKLISQGLSKNTQLQVLDLQDNTITTAAAVVLADALGKWEKLVELNLNDCLLKPRIIGFGWTFPRGKCQGTLFPHWSCNNNELEADALAKLASVVPHKLPNLKLLELNGNRFEEDSTTLRSYIHLRRQRLWWAWRIGRLEEIDSEDEDESDDEEGEWYFGRCQRGTWTS